MGMNLVMGMNRGKIIRVPASAVPQKGVLFDTLTVYLASEFNS
jgi:hypothetical protein